MDLEVIFCIFRLVFLFEFFAFADSVETLYLFCCEREEVGMGLGGLGV